MILNIDISEVFKQHMASGSDITVVYKSIEDDDFGFERCNTVNINEYGKVVTFGKNIKKSETDLTKKKISTEIYIVKKELLVDMITDAITTGQNIFLTDVLHNAVNKYKVMAFEFKGYLKNINTIEGYFAASMDMLDEEHIKEVFFQDNRIKTKVKDETPTYYSDDCNVTNSLIANGCKIEGTVINSIIFRRVNVAKGTIIKDSIIMQNTDIRENCTLENVILDKQVLLTEGTELKGSPKNPVVVGKGSIL